MKYINFVKAKLNIMLLITLVVLIGIIKYSTTIDNSKKTAVTAKNGVIDLRGWDFKKDGMVKLGGEWEFYDNRFLSPDDFNKNNYEDEKYSSIPGYFGKNSYGTYRLKLLVSNANDVYSIKMDFVQSAYKLWVNNREIISVGSIGNSKENMRPQLLPKVGSFFDKDGEIYLTLQVSNFYAKYGYVEGIIMGDSQRVESYSRKKLSLDLFLFGSTLMAAVYSLGMFWKRKKDKSMLYFCIVCIIVAIRTLFLGERFFISIFPNFSYILSGKIMHWTFYLYIPFIVLYISSFYTDIISKKVTKISIYSAYIYGVLVLISPWKYYLDLILPFEGLTIIFLSYLIYKISMVYISNDELEYITVIGLFSLLLTYFNDVLYEYNIILTGSFAPVGILIFIILNSYVLAERQSMALSNVEHMSEKLKSLNNLKDDFLAITSHELKTPLNGVIGLSEKLLNESIVGREDVKQDLSLINISAKRLSNLVNDIMVFSKLRNDGITLQKKPVNVGKIVDMVIKFCSASIDNKDISIMNLIDSSAPYVYGDEGRIQQILYNLIGNAIKFTSKGTVAVSWALKKDFMEICVEDDGIGISEDNIDKIFNIYEQVDGTSEKYGGTGLGLYITKQLIRLHGGTIDVKSVLNEGSKFIFTLPLCTDEQLSSIDNFGERNLHDTEEVVYSRLNTKLNSCSAGELPSTLNKCKVLIVDDEYVNQKVLEGYLKNSKFSIIKASNGKEALKLVEQHEDLDLIILDMMMPDLLGYEVCNLVREKYSLFELPILITTADNRLENLVVAFECGANDYLVKPFNRHELTARVNTLITLKHLVQEALSMVEEVAVANMEVENLSQKNEESIKRVEELVEFDKLRTEFFTNLTHELRTPINVICSTIQLLGTLDQSKGIGDEKIKYYLSIMNQNSLRLLRLVNNLIDMTKINGGYMSLNLVNGNIVYAVEELALSVADYIKSKNITITFDTEIEELIIAYDEEMLERIILNILSNAVKFTNEGGSIDINIFDEKDYVKISIKDSGIGIPEDKLEYIFERFAQVDKSMTRRSEGSGIGLSLVKSLVELHEGTIEAISKLGEGTEFIIKLPVKVLNTRENQENIIYKKVPESKYEKTLNIEFSDIYI